MISSARKLWTTVHLRAWHDDAGDMMAFLPRSCERVWRWSQRCQKAGRHLRPNRKEAASLSLVRYACGVLGLTEQEAAATKMRLRMVEPIQPWIARDLVAAHFEWLLRDYQDDIYWLQNRGY